MQILKKEILLDKAGTLKRFITEIERNKITHLKIAGFLNSEDFNVLGEMCSCVGEYDEEDYFTIDMDESPLLKVLDLGECVLTDNPYLGEFTFHSKLEKFVCPKNLVGTSDAEVFEDSVFLKTVVVPETFKEFGSCTFAYCKSLEEINFPNTLERIGSFAFCQCNALKHFKIPANVSIIECAAFCGCFNIEEFELEESNPHFSVAEGVLFNKDKTKLVAFPCGYKKKHYSIPEGVQIIGEGAFLDALIETITFPASLQIIEGWAFRFCENLKSIDIPDSVTEIGELAFEFCTELEKVKLPNKLTILKRQTFGGGKKLKEIDIPSSVKIIEEYSLGWSKSLETIHLHDGLEVLDDLRNCKTLKNILIPKTVKEIASGIFRGSCFMTEIRLDENNPYFCILEGALCSKDKTKLIAIPPSNEKSTFVIPNEVQEIADFVFEGFENLEKIIFPDSLQVIGHRVFEGCTSLKSLSFPASLRSIDFRTFDNCKKLEVIEIYAQTPPKIINPSSPGWRFMDDSEMVTLYVPKESLKEYKKAFGWKDIKKIEILP
jgi:hypothetical protein